MRNRPCPAEGARARGEEVIIARGSTPIARILPGERPEKCEEASHAREIILSIADDFDAPLEDFGGYAS